jgi:hypothetical protein
MSQVNSLPAAIRSNIHPRKQGNGRPRLPDRAPSSSERNINVKLAEPPSCSTASAIIFIGKNRRGNWVAQQQNGLYGGRFVSRAEAIRCALSENGHHPETIVELPCEIGLDMDDKLPSSNDIPATPNGWRVGMAGPRARWK